MIVTGSDGRLVPLISGALSITDPDEHRNAWQDEDEWRYEQLAYRQIMEERRAREERRRTRQRHGGGARA